MMNKSFAFLVMLLSQFYATGVFAQYTYFNVLYSGIDNPNLVPVSAFCTNDHYMIIEITENDNEDITLLRHLSPEGEIIYDSLIEFTGYSILLDGQFAYRAVQGGFLFAGMLSSIEDGLVGYANYFSESTTIYWEHYFDELSDETTSSHMSCIIKSSLTNKYWIGGNLGHNTDADVPPEEFSTYLAHLDSDGSTMEDWAFYEGENRYEIQEIFELDNGKLLLSGMVSLYSIDDHFLLLFNPQTGLIEQEEIWGSEWDEGRGNLRKMPDGNYYVFYDLIIDSDGEIISPTKLVQARLRKIDPYTLDSIWDIQIPIPDLEGYNRGIGFIGFEPTLDSGYVIGYNYVPLNNGLGEYHAAHLLKLNTNFEIEWIKQYFLPDGTEYYYDGITDVAIACDGGFICAGGYLIPPDYQQRQWTFKTDACGEIEMSDCPAVVEIIDYKKEKFIANIYPNPTIGILNIETTQSLANVVIKDIMGRIILEQTMSNSNQAIDVTKLCNGIYLIQLKLSNGEERCMKFIKE